jgi:hypothetical protein
MNREKLKTLVFGAVLGCAVLSIVAFSAGWIVTGSSTARQVQAAWVDGQATICASLAQDHRKATGDVADLSGYQARDARNELAKTYAVVLQGEDAADAGVISACSDLLKNSGA